jgi:hypothetical protein
LARNALLADPGVQAPGQPGHEARVGDRQGLLDLLVGGVRHPERDVLPHAHREQRGILEPAADQGAQHRQRQVADVGAVQGDRPGGWVGQPRH